ncbi:MAG TPA: hypothetical protein VNZ64_10175 [Candidatus Acidoferrum sp.]|jgi:hypothetical protein|nr:hypothetical protein [Candidatus Acidoferrum sp.]
MKHLVVFICLVVAVFDAAAAFRAAIAVRNVTPDPLLPVIGGIGPSHPVSRKEGELTVRALVLEDGATRVAFVSSDFLGFPAVLGNRVRAEVKGIPAGNILIGATHTHSAPDCYGFPDGKGGTASDPKYLETVCRRMTEALSEAVTTLQPARIRIATGTAKGKIAYNYYAEQLYDPRCSVIQVVDESGKPFAILVNYAIHPEVLGTQAGVCSPDLVGPLYDELSAKGGGTGIFMNSAQGGMVTADNRLPGGGEARDWPECRRIGTLLADEALRIVRDAPLQASPGLFCAARSVSLPVDSPGMRALMKQMPSVSGVSADAVTAQVNVVNVGNAQILTIPGEALPNIGYYLKRKMHGEHNLLFGLTNDAYGYILTKEDFDSFERYAYITRTSLGERTGEILVNEALKFVDACPRPPHLSTQGN